MLDVRFPGFGIVLRNVKDSITIFGVDIKIYGIIFALSFVVAYLTVKGEARRTKQNDEIYLDLLLWMFIPTVIGARLYYVLFSLKSYKGKSILKTFGNILNITNGGLALYGGIIAGIIVAVVFCKKKNVKFPLLADTVSLGLLAGQIIGRFGNFFNREAFGEFTDSKFAMCIPTDYYVKNGTLGGVVNSGAITEKMANNVVVYDSMNWISVHPTFLYEAFWNLVLLIALLAYRKHKKFDGEIFLMYLWGYGLGRVWIEGLRTDSLLFFGGSIKVSQLVAFICVIGASFILVKKRLDYAKKLA